MPATTKTERRSHALRKLRDNVACGACTTAWERDYLVRLNELAMRAPGSDPIWGDRDAYIWRLSRRHDTCTEFYAIPLRRAEGESVWEFEAVNNEHNGDVDVRVIYKKRGSRLYGPIESSPNKALDGFGGMVGSIIATVTGSSPLDVRIPRRR